MAYIEIPDGVPIYYNERGEGETIVLVHGWTCDSEFWWRKNVDALAADHHVVTYDLRGHGLSGKTDGGHSLSGYAEDLEFLAESLDLSEFREQKREFDEEVADVTGDGDEDRRG